MSIREIISRSSIKNKEGSIKNDAMPEVKWKVRIICKILLFL